MTVVEEDPFGPEAPAFDRQPPQDAGAELCVLGGMLLSKDAIGDVVEILTSADFYKPANSTIFSAIVHLYADGEPADPITVAAFLTDAGDISRVGGVPYLHTCVNQVPTAANAAYYARIVADRSLQRRLVESGTATIQYGYGQGMAAGQDVSYAVDLAQQRLHELTVTHDPDQDLTSGEMVDEALAEIYDLLEGTGDVVRTGLVDLDRILAGGFKPGQLILIAGRPAMGKSVLATDILRQVAIRDKKRVQMFSLEMSRKEIMFRIMSAETGVYLEKMLNPEMLHEHDWRLMDQFKADAHANPRPYHIDDTGGITLMEIKAKCRRRQQRQDLDLVIIDYLQLMDQPGATESRQQEVSQISRGLKMLAKELGVPVIALSQFNRNSEARSDKRPGLADLRESGSLEQDADVVIAVHRDDFYDQESPRAGEADLMILKNRNGSPGVLSVAAQLHVARFKDMAIV